MITTTIGTFKKQGIAKRIAKLKQEYNDLLKLISDAGVAIEQDAAAAVGNAVPFVNISETLTAHLETIKTSTRKMGEIGNKIAATATEYAALEAVDHRITHPLTSDAWLAWNNCLLTSDVLLDAVELNGGNRTALYKVFKQSFDDFKPDYPVKES
jgi:hypothetical protein